jgi:hypothetical protein
VCVRTPQPDAARAPMAIESVQIPCFLFIVVSMLCVTPRKAQGESFEQVARRGPKWPETRISPSIGESK